MRRSTVYLLLIGLIFALPFVPALIASFGGVWRFPTIIPDGINLRAWESIFSPSSRTLSAIFLSLWIAFCVTVINLMVGIPAAYALTRKKLRFQSGIEAVLLAPIFVPALAAVMGIHLTFLRLGLTETVIGVILVHLAPSMPYVIRAAMISFQTMNEEAEDAAKMLGATKSQRFYHIILPHLIPGLTAGIILSMLISLSQYSVTLLIGAGQVITLPILFVPFLNGGDPAIGAAYTLVFSIVALGLVLVLDGGLRSYYATRKGGLS